MPAILVVLEGFWGFGGIEQGFGPGQWDGPVAGAVGDKQWHVNGSNQVDDIMPFGPHELASRQSF